MSTDECWCDPNDLFDPPDPRPRVVAGCPAHRARGAAQQFAVQHGGRVGTLHEKLLARITELGQHLTGCTSCSTCEAAALGHGVRATVELHAPVAGHRGIGVFCGGCGKVDDRTYLHVEPCPTKRAIADALGVQIGETP